MKVFLETSIQIHRLLHTRARKDFIRRQLDGKTICTSDYVLMEFRRGVSQSLAYLRTLLLQIQREEDTTIYFPDLLVRISETSGLTRSLRNLQRVLLVLALLADEYKEFVIPIDDAIFSLEFQMNALEGEAFFEGIDEFIRSTDCDLIKPEAQIGDFVTSRLSCNRTTAQCRLVEFLSQREQELESIEHAIRNLPKKERDSRVLQALGRIRNDKTVASGEQNCWALGDVIIALSVPDDAFIYTIDHHFEVICQALGKKLFVEGS